MNDEVRSVVNSLELQKSRVTTLEQDYQKLIAFSNMLTQQC